ncbi:MAG TPA: hypothetical protein VMU99_02915 [Acidimicrobiales bacterium]|nr:hypothetical protein [Acidimicrobiales bacterium]
MASPRPRGHVAIITPMWGEDETESIAVIRLVAGALARHFNIDVIHLDQSALAPGTYRDSVFDVHRFPAVLPDRQQESLLRVALGIDRSPNPLPDPLTTLIEERASVRGNLNAFIDDLAPQAIILIGSAHPYDLDALCSTRHPRIIFMPLGERILSFNDRSIDTIMHIADLVIASDPGELSRLQQAFPGRAKSIVPLDLALSVNRAATSDTLFGVRFFQPFVLMIRRFGGDERVCRQRVTHAIVTSVAGPVERDQINQEDWRTTDEMIPEVLPISVAEVDGGSWKLSDNVNMLPLPVNPSRVNLWRLMAHALFTIDLRPATAFGREAIESMMFDSPVIVPDDSAAKEHVEAANGGLWYRNNGELLDAVRVLTDRSIREQLARNGRAYVTRHHSDLDAFVERIGRIVSESPFTDGEKETLTG